MADIRRLRGLMGAAKVILSDIERNRQQQQEMGTTMGKTLLGQYAKRAFQTPMEQLLQKGQVAGAIAKISAAGGDVSQFQGLFGGVQPPTREIIDTTARVEEVEPTAITPAIPASRPRFTGAPVEPITPEIAPEQRILPTKFERTPLGGIRATVFEDVALKKRQQQEETKLKAKAEVLKLSEKARANFGRSIGLFSTMVSQAKGMQEEQKGFLGKAGIETTGLGLLPGMAGTLAVKTRRPGAARTAAFRGQMRETAIGLNSILTGQNRVIRSVVQMIQETLPDPLDPEPMMATKLAQSITNAYKLVKAFEKAGLSPDKIQRMSEGELSAIDARSLAGLYTLSSREEQEIDRIIDDVLATPAMAERRFGREEELPEGITEEDIEHTMRLHNLSREEVLRRIGR